MADPTVQPAGADGEQVRVRGATRQSYCMNCGADRSGSYCSACGQQYLDRPLTFGHLVRAFISRVFDLDQGLLYTIRRLAVDPGSVARAYVKGRQKPYVGPLAFMVVATAVFIGSFELVADSMRSIFEAQGQSAADPAVVDAMDDYVKPYAALLFTVSVLPVAWVQQRVFRSVADYTFAETLIMVLYCAGQATLYTGILQLVIMVAVPSLTGILIVQGSTLLIFPIIAHGAYGFYRKRWKDVWLTFAISFTVYMVALVAVIVAVIVLVAWLNGAGAA
ncbi:DUF3667 domain-containing protein [Longibacter sp.]|uniref:DUF3667 domain-containing protein n=1 Tax=Longibacter sp. TaxID=2045415 RepID=UPI003EB7D74C